jgi:dCMP deaminase
MDTAERFAALSTAKRLQVGAIIVKDNRIISIGYNGMPSGWDNECEYVIETDDLGNPAQTKTKPEVIHAEANAIAKLAASAESGKDADMYVTHAPCLDCAKQIYTMGINRLYYKNNYKTDAGINFLRKCNIEVIQL